MELKLGVLGASGRMGREILNCVGQGFSFRGVSLKLSDLVVGETQDFCFQGIEARTLNHPQRNSVDIWIDFSHPQASLALLNQIEQPIVMGTTGFNADEEKIISDYSRRAPVLMASNTSLGVSLVQSWLESLPEILPYDLVLEEEHHRHKKDAPSGTAKSMLKELEKRGPVQVVSNRAGDTKGIHILKLIGEGERIEIHHTVTDRKVFALGALRAACFLGNQKKVGTYSMRDVYQQAKD